MNKIPLVPKIVKLTSLTISKQWSVYRLMIMLFLEIQKY